MKKISFDDYYNRVYGSWLGRISGDFVGAPLEFKPYKYIKILYGNLEYYPKRIDLNYVNDDEMYEICALVALQKNGINISSIRSWSIPFPLSSTLILTYLAEVFFSLLDTSS